MKTITIRDLRQRWPQAEAALKVEGEILITRDSKPVAKLVRIVEKPRRRKRWDPDAHMKWLKKMWGDKVFDKADEYIARERADRWEREPS
jgi:antitoxin (DNA-binding transcriptional repressor) of toxin-antitoxin stability system